MYEHIVVQVFELVNRFLAQDLLTGLLIGCHLLTAIVQDGSVPSFPTHSNAIGR
jgi:hypothetical protein